MYVVPQNNKSYHILKSLIQHVQSYITSNTNNEIISKASRMVSVYVLFMDNIQSRMKMIEEF